MEIPIISWFDEPVKKSVSSVFGGVNASVEAWDLFKKYRAAHFAMLREAVGKVKVLGMSTPMSLLDLYYPVRVSSDIRRRLYQSEWLTTQSAAPRSSAGTEFRAIDGSQYVEKSNRLVVLGGPGAGKTTFLKYLALAYSEKVVFEGTKLKTSKLPFFVSLPELSKVDLGILDFISRPLIQREDEYAKDFIERSLKKGLAVVLLDSLDEVPDAGRASVIQRVKDFSISFPETKLVVSCRTADYKEVLENFDEAELVRLSRAAVRKIIGSWFKGDKNSAAKLLQVIESDAGIASLTETPLLLSLLCIQFRHDLILPRRKIEVYKRCVETLLRDWDTTRGFRRTSAYESLSDDHKERLFEHIAGRSSNEDQTYVLACGRLYELASEYISRLGLVESDAASVIHEIESHHGIIERHSMESFCFSHASIQDYFMARYALSRRIEMQVVKSRLEDESWAGVIEFICGLHAEPDEIFDLMVKRANLKDLKNYPAIERRAKLLFLIYRCLSVGPVLTREKAREVNSHILSSVQGFLELMAKSGVYAMCSYTAGGVRHPYFHVGQKRPSLHAALLPYRKLSNEILVRSVPDYAKAAFESCETILLADELNLLEISTLLNTVVPLSKVNPDEVLVALHRLKEKMGSLSWLVRIIDESVATIQAS